MIFEYKDKIYPKYIKEGNAISYILPYAKYYLRGDVLDIGGTKEWHYPGADIINITIDDEYDAMNLPNRSYDSIISSHCLEHLADPREALKVWGQHLEPNGCLFLYLPHVNMDYWAFDNKKHLHVFTPEIIKGWLERLGFENIITSGQDLYYSFSVVAWKKD
jgi:SAM-dependent methyltransferase